MGKKTASVIMIINMLMHPCLIYYCLLCADVIHNGGRAVVPQVEQPPVSFCGYSFFPQREGKYLL